ncbi:hypothetical protein ACFWUP_30305 [Nocardia sp. NPDC058658]|uniref:hypothetical protein n=1 Tax=Nocardia sp. NPDC058658 TaxID=3346580 RepID=UPI00365D46D5
MNSIEKSIGTSDYDRVVRSIALLLAVSYFAYTLMLSSRIIAQAPTVALWWTVVATAVVLVAPAVLFSWAAGTGSPQWVALAATVSVAGFPLATLAWPLAWHGVALAASSWLSFVPGLAAMAAALLWRPAFAVTYLLVVTAGAQAINQQRTPSANFAYALELVYSFGFSLVFVATVIEALRTARLLDQTKVSASLQAADAAAAQARTALQRTHAGIVHDWVLATLLAAERLPHSEQLQQQAITTLAKIDTLPAIDLDRTVSAQQAVRAIQTAVEEVSQVAVAVRTEPEEIADYDAGAVAAMASGCAEAVRNSLRHNSSDVRPEVALVLTADCIEATVRDRGTGFDITAVPASRLGVNGSIRELDRIAGGAVTVTSLPGHGTVVNFAWQRPAARDTVDVRDFLGVRRRAAIAVTIVYLAGVCALVTMSAPGVPDLPNQVSMLLYATMALAFLWAPGDPIPRWVSGFAVLGPLGAWLALRSLPAEITTEQLWPASATAAIYVLLMLRGRPVAAWLGQVGILGTYAIWAVGHRISPVDLVVARLADLAPLVGGAVFARLVRPRLHSILTLRRDALRQAGQTAAARAAYAAHTQQLKQFDATSRALLTRLTFKMPLTPLERRECGLVEAQLRDQLRGGLLARSPVAEQIARARARGVSVHLYDDHTGPAFDPATWARVTSTITTELARLGGGMVTIRIPPPGREVIATIVARDATGTRRVAVAAAVDAPQ